MDDVARQLGMRRIGWIFTDLIADDMQKGTVGFKVVHKTSFAYDMLFLVVCF